jgi:UDP-glucose 4-epimerase
MKRAIHSTALSIVLAVAAMPVAAQVPPSTLRGIDVYRTTQIDAETIELCSGKGVRLLDLVEDLCAMSRTPVRVEVDPARVRPADVPYLVGDPARVTQVAGWTPRRSMEQTLTDLLEHWRRVVPEV